MHTCIEGLMLYDRCFTLVCVCHQLYISEGRAGVHTEESSWSQCLIDNDVLLSELNICVSDLHKQSSCSYFCRCVSYLCDTGHLRNVWPEQKCEHSTAKRTGCQVRQHRCVLHAHLVQPKLGQKLLFYAHCTYI